ncbi:type I secretion system permease/ATPase [Leisingera sp. SS27]|uniref:type I secretion system permease/ATPase n=1 Tax=Leisingera sp. SS27 TaxID=2979462 RepID=UPI00232F58A2|nr:type I secretion system permease/ATPase [Leisingera sp. SS27]MDC0659526.1 type I secretion system permease/ATPase [Leisingera sp. SS27]
MSAAAESLQETAFLQGGGLAAADPRQDSGLMALMAAARRLDVAAEAAQVWHMHGKTDAAFEDADIIRCAKRLGIKARLAALPKRRLLTAPMPYLIRKAQSGQWYAVTGTIGGQLQVTNPLTGGTSRSDPADVAADFEDDVILCSREPSWKSGQKAFGFSWFLPSILKHKARFRRILLASLVIQGFALVSPKLFEVVIDKVLVSRGLQSLDVLAIALIGIAFFEPLMTFLRSLVFSHMASCANSELSARLFRHLVYLPLDYFRNRQAGQILARVKELDHIRNFLTGSALMMVVDLCFISVFLAVMFAYSSKLAFVVLATLAVFGLMWLVIGPFLRKRVEREYERHAENSAFLTETVTGIETIKSLGLGGQFARAWEDRLGASLKATFDASMLGHWAGGGIGLVQKISAALLLWFGVSLVMAGELSVGQLVAFNMLSGHVTMPILRLAQIWQDFQHTGISIRRIGDILQEEPETAASAGRSSLEEIKGRIDLRKVTFRYAPDGAEVLRRLDLTVQAGEVVGLTGLSGSGKSTVTKLVQRLYVPQSGQVLVDNVDLAMADPANLRRNMGVVLQENFLFNGSVWDNIALGNPTAKPEDILNAARLSGASDFIEHLRHGFDTQVGERGGNLSGGQRQRIAIARALVADPKILIFDEATSALDYETEAGILQRLPEIIKGRTVIMIAHRLNCMPLCDRVVVMDKGEIIEQGPHAELLSNGHAYAELWQLQNGD